MLNKQVTRAFASGLLLSAIFLFGFQIFSDPKTTVKEGYIEVKKSQYDDLKKASEIWKQQYNELKAKQQSNTNTTTNNSTPKEETVTKYHLKITEGMTPDEVASQLKSAGIIKDDNKFTRFLIDKKYHEKVQIGEYDLTSKMDFTQIAKIITKNR